VLAMAAPLERGPERGERVLVARSDRRTAARVVDRRLWRRRPIERGERSLAVAKNAFGIGAGARQAGEVLRGHAASAARVVVAAARACPGRLGPAKLDEQVRMAPHLAEAARRANVAREELLVDRERARIHVPDGVDQADHSPRAAEVEAGK